MSISVVGAGANDHRGQQLSPRDGAESKSWLERIDLAISKSRRIRGGNYVQ
jgi:hypothetical protein